MEDSIFYQYFKNEYGIERWQSLFKSLQQPSEKIARINPFWYSKMNSFVDAHIINFENQKHIPISLAKNIIQANPSFNEDQLFYYMDLASVLPPLFLDPKIDDQVLDMCAAPGGKSLILISLMYDSLLKENFNFDIENIEKIDLQLNELSKERRSRLLRVLRSQLPESIFKQIQVSNHDASRWSQFHPASYDKILLDVPCSGERHKLENPKEIAEWVPRTTKQMAMRQFAILASAFDSLKSGGELVYSTCSISKCENDEVIEKLFKKRKGQFEIKELNNHSIKAFCEPTKYGYIILPDKNGFGPIYMCGICKN